LSAADLARLLAVTRALAEPFELNAMLATVAEAACTVLDAERASIWLLDEAAQALALTVSSDLPAVRMPVGQGLVGACAADRRPLVVPDCSVDPRFDAATDLRSGFRTRGLLALPLLDAQERLVGVMQVLNRRQRPFEAGDLPLAEALAAQCAIALSRVRLLAASREAERLQRELEVARRVQLDSLPGRLPEVEGYDLHAVFRPAEQTGGDTYDVSRSGDRLRLVIGDAAGHGIAPALMVTQMHAMLRMAFRMGADLEHAFREVNDQLAATYLDGRFVTAFIGELDLTQHRIRFLSGGQSPILHFHAATGRCTRLGSTSFPMGAMPLTRPAAARDVDLAPGDVLLLATDGVYEASHGDGTVLGAAAVEALLAEHAGRDAAGLAQHLLELVASFGEGAAPDDDITLVVVRRHGTAALPPTSPTPRERNPP
jgi:phosphoserine phosphatase